MSAARPAGGRRRWRAAPGVAERAGCDMPSLSSPSPPSQLPTADVCERVKELAADVEDRFFPLIRPKFEADRCKTRTGGLCARFAFETSGKMSPPPVSDLNGAPCEGRRIAATRAPTLKCRRRGSLMAGRWLMWAATLALAGVVWRNAQDFLVSCQMNGLEPMGESRAENALGPTNLLHKPPGGQQQPNLSLSQLVNFLNSISNNNNNNNNQVQQQQQRRSPQTQPLPLATLGNQRAGLPQPVSSSTPVNPFLAAAQFQPTRRQQQQQQQQQPPASFNQAANNQQANFQVASSSPATPLTLNRIPNSFMGPRFSGTNQPQLQLQPLNTIPLGQRAPPPPPLMQMQPRAGTNPGAQRTLAAAASQQPRSSLKPPPQQQPAQQMNGQQPARPIITGFAPSGPPPSLTAISVVQSPPNAIGQPEPPTTTTSTTTTTTTTTSTPPETTRPSSSTTPTSSTTSGQTMATNSGVQQTSTSSTSTSDSFSSPAGLLVASSEPEVTVTPGPWNPVNNRTTIAGGGSSLAPSPDIVTVPPGYDPNQPPAPQSYDIAVSAQIGPSASNQAPQQRQQSAVAQPVEATPTLSSSPAPQPTETTTIIWSSEPATSSSSSSSDSMSVTQTSSLIAPTRTQTQSQLQSQSQTRIQTQPVMSQTGTSGQQIVTRIRDNSLAATQYEEPAASETSAESGVVYGKAASREAKPPKPAQADAGRGFIQTAQLDTQVRPFAGASSQPKLAASGPPFKASRPMVGGVPAASVASAGFTIVASGNQTMPTGDIQDYVAGAPPPIVPASGEPTISAQGGPDPASFELESAPSLPPLLTESTATPRLRRPTFKPKPAVPPIRIDSCIVGDDSSCDQSHNERCITEYGISSCHCKPGFARLSQLRGFCSPISLFQFALKIDRLADDRRLAFNQTLENPNSEEYQFLEFETVQALASALQQTQLARLFMGARVQRFYERKGRVWANVSINLEANNVTRSERVQQLAGQELAKLLQTNNNNGSQKQRPALGDSLLVLDGSRESFSKLTDVNECASKELNDCSKHATCTNDFGGYSCHCLTGYEDKYLAQATGANSTTSAADQQPEQRAKMGRICMGCSASYCSNRGECFIQEGRKQCKCRPNFMGARCDIDSEVLFVAVGGSLVGLVILIITFWCLYVFNRRWRREQHKMDAMSATSGLTYNYVNSSSNSSNSLMVGRASHPPAGRAGSAAAYAAAMVGQRFVGVAGERRSATGANGHLSDQQAIIGSASSSSSAASQPIACNPYATGAYQYEDAGLLLAPASSGGSSEQTSPGASSYGRGHSNYLAAAAAAAAGNAYTLSGHHHHHLLAQQQQHQQQMAHLQHQAHHHHQHQHQHQNQSASKHVSQFHPAFDYARTLNSSANYHHHHHHQQQQQQQLVAANGYDTRWRTLQQHDNGKQQLAGYYLVR